MEYRLNGCRGKGHWKIYNPSPEEIDRAIDELLPAKYHFVIIDHNKCDENFWYIQATIVDCDKDSEIKYHVDTRIGYGDNIAVNCKQYRYYTTDADELKRIFRMYVLGVRPDISYWEDYTEELENSFKDKNQTADVICSKCGSYEST